MPIKNKDVINWYPGHMNKSINIISSKISDIDFYIEVLDARATKFSSNSDINKIFQNKPKITIALKKDLADLSFVNKDILYGSIKDKKFRNLIINEIKNKCASLVESKKRKGYVNFQLCGIVVGLPNIGKSSLINFLSNKNQMIVQNKPGVTKKISFIKLVENIVLFDTPGIFFKKVEQFEIGAILTIIKSVNFEIVNKYEILEFCYEFMMNNYQKEMFDYFKFNEILSFDQYLNYLCDIKKFKLKNNECDFDRCFDYLYYEFSNSKICLVNFDKYFIDKM